jgi:hypothetical protein
VGQYQVEVTKNGFSTLIRNGITLQVGQEASIDITLRVGSTNQSVTVTAEASLVQTTTSTIGSIVNQEEITSLPLNGRNMSDLTLLNAGVTQTYVFSPTVVTSGLMTGVTESNNGMPVHSNNYMLDGANMKSPWGMNNSSIVGTTLGLDGVEEYKVVSNVPDATYGLYMGGQTAIVSKGGTNQFHGDVFDYLRNASLDAQNFFDAHDTLNFNGYGTNKSLDYPDKRIPPYHRNNFGASFGGPIRRDKTFVYAAYEAIRQTWGQTITTTTLPGACFDATTHLVTAASLSTCSGVATTNINPYVLNVLSSPDIVSGQSGLFPFPNTNINSAGTALAGATYDYSFPFVQPTAEDYGQIRVDENLSASDSIFARYTQDDSRQTADGAYSYQRNYEFGSMQFVTLSETHIFTPSTLNTARVSFSRNLTLANSSETPRITSPLGILAPGQDMGNFTPAGTVTGLTYIAADGQYVNDFTTYSDDFFLTKGKHGLRFGTLINRMRTPSNGHFYNRGAITFSTIPNLAQGIYSTMIALGGSLTPSQERRFLAYTFGFYGQDDYRITPRLTLNLGLRWEFTTIPTETNGNNWQIQDIATANGNSPTQGAVKSQMWSGNPSLHAISPRFGFAWDVSGNGKTAIRGGGGIYYDIPIDGGLLFQQACCQPPLDYFNTVNNPYGTVAAMNANGIPPFQIPLPIAYGSAPVTTSNPNGVVSTFIGLASPRNINYQWHQPTDYQWNLAIDRQLPGNQNVSVAYVGARGVHIVQLAEGNPTTILGYLPDGLPYFCHPADNPTGPPTSGDQCPTNASYPAKSNPTYGPIAQNSAASETWYEALQVNTTKHLTHGLAGGIAYTWAKEEDFGSGEEGIETAVGEGGIYFPSVNRIDKAVGGFDVANNFRANLTYVLPSPVKSQGWAAKALGGWRASDIVVMQGGYPFSPVIGNRSLSNDPTAAGATSDRANLDPSYNPGQVITHKISGWFNTSMFDLPLAGTLGTAGRNIMRGPDLINWDTSITKDTPAHFLGEEGTVEFRAEFFNVLNHPDFSNPTATIASLSSPAAIQCGPAYAITSCQFGSSTTLKPNATAGQITSTTENSREIQFSLRLVF